MKYWFAAIIACFMGMMWAGSFLAYNRAYQLIGPLHPSIQYLWKLATSTPFIPGLAISLVVSLLRMWLFGQVGTQRTWFLEPVILTMATFVVMYGLKEHVKPTQWLGAAIVLCGMLLVMRK